MLGVVACKTQSSQAAQTEANKEVWVPKGKKSDPQVLRQPAKLKELYQKENN